MFYTRQHFQQINESCLGKAWVRKEAPFTVHSSCGERFITRASTEGRTLNGHKTCHKLLENLAE